MPAPVRLGAQQAGALQELSLAPPLRTQPGWQAWLRGSRSAGTGQPEAPAVGAGRASTIPTGWRQKQRWPARAACPWFVLPTLSRNRIQTTTRKGMAAKHAAQGQISASHHSPPLHGLLGVDRTRGRVATDWTNGWSDGGSVTPQDGARETAGYPTAMGGFRSHGLPARTRSSLSSAAVRWYELCAVAGRAMKTRSVPPGADEARRR